MSLQQDRITKVLENIIILCEDDNFNTEVFSAEIEILLDKLQGEDFFGAEGQCDPRGDFRDQSYSLHYYIQGADDESIS